MGDRVLIVEDEARLREILCDYFAAKGEEPVGAENGQAALEYLQDHTVDAVLLDILMPELDGFTVCRAVRKNSSVPIIFLTALSDEDDKLRGYELGADDYVTKPFSLAVLYAKTMALIRRGRGVAGTGKLSCGFIELDEDRGLCFAEGREVKLSPRAYKLLGCLLRNKGLLLSREQLLDRVWGMDFEGDERAVDIQIKNLRASLGNAGKQIETVRGMGYRLREEETK